MQQEQVYPIYKYCTSNTIQGNIGQLISIMGKVTQTRPQQATITIEINPETSQTLSIIIPALTIDYLLEQVDFSTLKEKEDLVLAQKYINFCQSDKGNGNYKEKGAPSSLIWFTIEKGDNSNKNNIVIEQNTSNLPTTLIKKVSAYSFSLNQYIEVRGKCLDSKTVELMQFTDLQDTLDIHSYNNALNLLINNCKQLVQ